MDFGVVGRSPLPKERLRLGTRKIEPQGEESSPQEGRSFSSFRPRSSRRKIGNEIRRKSRKELPVSSARGSRSSRSKIGHEIRRTRRKKLPASSARGERSSRSKIVKEARYPSPQGEDRGPQEASPSCKKQSRLSGSSSVLQREELGLLVPEQSCSPEDRAGRSGTVGEAGETVSQEAGSRWMPASRSSSLRNGFLPLLLRPMPRGPALLVPLASMSSEDRFRWERSRFAPSCETSSHPIGYRSGEW